MSKKFLSTRRVVVAGFVGGATVLVGPWALVNSLTYGHRYDTVASTPKRQVALVLGAGLNPDGSPSDFLAQRLDVTVTLWRAGRVQQVLVSGDNSTVAHDEPQAMSDYLVAHGVPLGAITQDDAGLDTYDSCYRARHVFGVSSMTVVTQDYHLPRAVFLCRSVGVDAVGVGGSEWGTHPSDMLRYQSRELLGDGKALLAGWVVRGGATYGGPPITLSSAG